MISSRRAEFVRGWPVLIAATLGSGTGVAPLAFYSLGALVSPLSQEFGWSRAQVTGAALALSLGMLAMGTFAGSLADRFGARPVALTSQCILAVMLCSLSLIHAQIWTLYLGYFALGSLAAGTLPITWSRAVTSWFVQARGFALGLSLIGTGVVGLLLPTYVTWLVGRFGWRGAYFGLAALPLVLGMPLALRYFHEPRQVQPRMGVRYGQQASLRPNQGSVLREVNLLEATRAPRFWQMATAFLIAALVIGAVNVHAIPLLSDRGIERSTAAVIVGLIGATVSIGRLISGYLLDTFADPRVAFVMLGAPACACVLLAVCGANLPLCALAVMLIGLAAGAEHDIAAYFAARYFGRSHFGAVYGLLYTLYTCGAGIGPPLAGAAFDRLGNYNVALYVGAALFAVAALLVGTLGPYPESSEPVCLEVAVGE